MESQVKWGIGLIVIGCCISPFGFPFLLIYAIPLIAIGAALILFKKREEEIEGSRKIYVNDYYYNRNDSRT